MTEITEPLKFGTLDCPTCKAKLKFELLGPIRVKRKVNNSWVYSAACPKCNKEFTVQS